MQSNLSKFYFYFQRGKINYSLFYRISMNIFWRAMSSCLICQRNQIASGQKSFGEWAKWESYPLILSARCVWESAFRSWGKKHSNLSMLQSKKDAGSCWGTGSCTKIFLKCRRSLVLQCAFSSLLWFTSCAIQCLCSKILGWQLVWKGSFLGGIVRNGHMYERQEYDSERLLFFRHLNVRLKKKINCFLTPVEIWTNVTTWYYD